MPAIAIAIPRFSVGRRAEPPLPLSRSWIAFILSLAQAAKNGGFGGDWLVATSFRTRVAKRGVPETGRNDLSEAKRKRGIGGRAVARMMHT